MLKGKTQSGFDFVIDEVVMDDMELLEDIVKADKDTMLFPGILEKILGADQNHTGILTSPVLSGGCGVVTVEYFRETLQTGSSFTIEIKSSDGSSVLKSEEHVDGTLERYVKNTINFTFNLTGDYIIVITAHDITTNDVSDELGIISVSWTGYTE